MSARYDQKAKELCRKLYCDFGGGNFDAIEAGMQKVYSGWRRSNLFDRKKKKTDKVPHEGWINKYGFDNSLKLYAAKLVSAVNDDQQELYLEVKNFREVAHGRAINKDATRDDLYLYRDFVKLTIDAMKALDLSKDNLDTFVACYEKLVRWLGEIDPKAAKGLLKNGERLVALAQTHYGKPEEQPINDGAGPGEDAGGEQPARGLRLVGNG